jgi:hypothetical protein
MVLKSLSNEFRMAVETWGPYAMKRHSSAMTRKTLSRACWRAPSDAPAGRGRIPA